MKKIEAIIDPWKTQEVKNALTKIGIRRMTISKVDEFGSQEAHKESFSHSVLLAVTPESSLIHKMEHAGCHLLRLQYRHDSSNKEGFDSEHVTLSIRKSQDSSLPSGVMYTW